VDEEGGEGMMIRQPNSMYELKRSRTLQKVKLFKDAECMVLSYEPGKGKHKGVMGALRVQNCKGGAEFKLGTGFNDDDRRHPPEIGSTVTYRYQELTDKGVPRFPTFLRIHPGI
jgi:DNA ligase-1